MEQADLISELKRLFDNAKNIDEFEFVNILISFNGMGDQRALTHLYESRDYITDMKARYHAAESLHSKAILALHIYCHTFEMDELYNILGNLLRIAINQQLRYLPELYSGREEYFTPTEKFNKLTNLAEQCRFEGFITGLETLYLNELRNAFVHSAYSLIEDEFWLVRGNGIHIGDAKHHTVSISQFLLPLIDRAIDFIDQFFKIIDDSKMAYRTNKIVQARMPGPQPVVILGDPETGLIGFQTFVGSWIKIQPGYGSTQFAQAMNIRFDSRVDNPELNTRLEAYIEKLTPYGRDFDLVRDEVIASGDANLLKNLAMIYYNYGNNALASKVGKPLRQQVAILKSASERYDLAIAIDQKIFRAYHNKGTALIQLAKLEDNYSDNVKKEVLELFDKSLAIEPNMYEAWLNSGRVLADLNNYEPDGEKQLAGFYESIHRYQKAIAIYPHDHLAYDNLGWLYRRLSHLTEDNEKLFNEGISAYETASRLNPGIESTLALSTFIAEYGEAFEALTEEKTREAISLLEKALQDFGNSADTCYRLGNKYAQLGTFLHDSEILKTSVRMFDEAVSLDASHIQAINNGAHTELALTLYEEKDKIAVEKLNLISQKLDKLLKLDAAHSNAWYNLGLVRLEIAKRNGKQNTEWLLKQGISELTKAEGLEPGLAIFDLARANALAGNKNDTLKYISQWVAIEKNKWKNAGFKDDFEKFLEDPDFKSLTAG
jgi:tetratricopeptide (TPR) repeat protein